MPLVALDRYPAANRRLLLPLLAAALVAASAAGGAASPAWAAVGCSSVPGDVNGDGYAEAVVGSGNAAHIFYGHPSGVVVDARGTALDDQLFTRDTPGVPGNEESGRFGYRNVLADFNDDGCADLAVSDPYENDYTGSVTVLYGSTRGISTTGAQRFTRISLFGAGPRSQGGEFGVDLASGDLNDDGVADLAVGVWGEHSAGVAASGAVAVIYGSTDGLNEGSIEAALISQASPGVPGVPERRDLFGAAVATGDFDGNGVGDLAVGVLRENRAKGIVQVLPGMAGAGVGRLPATSYNQNTAGVPGVAERGDSFGAALAAGDVTGDGRADLAVGAPGENESSDAPELGEGAVTLLPGSPSGLTGNRSQTWSQRSPGVGGVPGDLDQFGASLAIAPLNSGKYLDLAVGAPGDDVRSTQYTGSVTILLGTGSGLSTAGAGGRRLHQDTPGIGGAVETNDSFGGSVATPHLQSEGQASLVIGAPWETVRGKLSAGMVHQLAATPSGPSATESRTFHLSTPGVKGTAALEGLFGGDVS